MGVALLLAMLVVFLATIAATSLATRAHLEVARARNLIDRKSVV